MVTGLLMRFLMWVADRLDPEEDWSSLADEAWGVEEHFVQIGEVIMPVVTFMCDCENCVEMATRRMTQIGVAPWQ